MKLIKMNERDYHAHHALGSSDIKQLLQNPHGFRQEKTANKAQELGSLVHKLILEPDEFASSYYVLDNIDKRTKEGKEKYIKALAEAEAENKEIIDLATYNQGKEIAEAFKNSAVSKLITDGVAEYCAFSEIDGVAVKCKPDYYRSDKKIIIDLKTTSVQGGASALSFQKAVANYRYYIQASLYMKILGAEEFYFIAIETQSPFMIGVYKLDIAALELGETQIKKAIKRYKNLNKYKANVYLDDSYKVVKELRLPNWCFYENDDE